MRETVIELFKEEMKFSAGHFTIFSATERENLHGHNFTVYVALRGPVLKNGLFSDYGPFKKEIIALCREWNEIFLLPSQSPFLKIEDEGDYTVAVFDGQRIPFLKRDVEIIPVENTTLEEMSRLFCSRLIERCQERLQHITEITVKVASGPGQFASYVRQTGG